MKTSKRKKLESKGWRVGTTDEFLNLSPEESAYLEIKLHLSQNLKYQRKRKKITQEEFARLIKSSQSRIAKMEASDPSVSIDLLIRSLLALGTSQKTLAQILAKSSNYTVA
jgi:DNA-binding XRE family transcriptional regulator